MTTPASIALVTVGYLFGGFLVGIGQGFVVGSPEHGAFAMARNVVAGIIAIVAMSYAAARWGRAIALRIGAPDVRRATIFGALSFGPVSVVVGLMLTAAEAAACVAYLAIYLLMDFAGWRVGGPDAAKRATMLVVTGLGCLGAAFAGGAAMGVALLRRGDQAALSYAR